MVSDMVVPLVSPDAVPTFTRLANRSEDATFGELKLVLNLQSTDNRTRPAFGDAGGRGASDKLGCDGGFMIRNVAIVFVYVSLVTGLSLRSFSQTSTELQDYFKNSVGLSDNQIADLRGGKAIGKVLKSRTPAEIFVFGAVYIKASPESYVHFASDFDRLRKLPEFLAIGRFSDPPQASDLEGFEFDKDDINALKECRPRHCEVQMPAESIEEIHKSVDWDAPDLDHRVNQHLHQRVIKGLEEYRREGNQALGEYSDKENPTDVAKQFEYMLGYARTLPAYLPGFHRYLLAYPNAKSPNIEDTFYWAKVKFGLKPTLRVVQLVTFRGQSPKEPAYAIAEKQLYSSHYFETALDLTFCVRGTGDSKDPGFYLIKEMGSEQAGLTGLKGSIVRKVATGRSASSLEKSLAAIKDILESKPAQ